MKHDLKSTPVVSKSTSTTNLASSNFADSENRRFLIVTQEDAEKVQSRIRRKTGVEEIQQRIVDLAARKGFGVIKISGENNETD